MSFVSDSNMAEVLVPETRKLTAVGTDAHLRFVFEFTERHYVWAYKIAVFNPTSSEIEIRGRRWEIEWGDNIEIAPPQTEKQLLFSPSFAGGRPVIPSGDELLFETAIVTESPVPPKMKGLLEFYNRTTGAEGYIPVRQFAFEHFTIEPLPPVNLRLEGNDVKIVAGAIAAYNRFVEQGGGARFRPDRLDLTPEGMELVNCFLFASFRSEMNKGRNIDFEPILPAKLGFPTRLRTTDHYIHKSNNRLIESKGRLSFYYVVVYNYWEVLVKKSADAGLKKKIAEIRAEYGFEDAVQELLGTASPEERAQVAGTIAAVFRKSAKLKTAASSKSKVKQSEPDIPAPPVGYSWPTQKYENSKHRGKKDGILQFLRDEWLELIKAKVISRPLLSKVDSKAEIAIRSYERNNGRRRKLPADISVPTRSEEIDLELSKSGIAVEKLGSLSSSAYRRTKPLVPR